MSPRRALIVAAASPAQLQVIEQRPEIVIAADSGVHAVLARGWIPELVVGDLDSARAEAVAAAVAGGAVVEEAAPDKDETDLELALAAALVRAATDIRIIVRGDGRLDHQLANLVAMASPSLASATVSASIGEHEVWVVRGVRQLELEPGRQLALMPVGGSARVTSRGVAFPLDDEELSPFEGRGIANTVTEPVVDLAVEDGVVLVLSSPRRTNDPGVARG